MIKRRLLPITVIGEKQKFYSDPIVVSYFRPSSSMWEGIEAKGIEKSADSQGLMMPSSLG